MNKLNSVLIVAGTHGNELSGIYLHKLIKEKRYSVERSTFSADSIITNSEAVKRNVRYIDTDLNREFSVTNSKCCSDLHESKIAHQFIDQYANQEKPLIVDLHNTTSNMGATLILLSNDVFYRKLGAYVKQRMPSAHILFEERKEWQEQSYLCTAGQYGIMIEVGAQAHGTLKYETVKLMKQMLTAVLDYVEKHNLNQIGLLSEYDAFFYTEEIKIPLDQEGMRQALVHPTICGRDFEAVKPGAPILATFAGYDIHWNGQGDIYPHFINESAYSKANIAMALAEQRRVSPV
ncbi:MULTISPECIES: aspartoacylase [Vibrio]|jgi:aspartoacylase|uniref:aspartoacylase n=1 Tax=Vibrio TaxID=662 RepID=UPI00137722F9|nr:MULTISPECIES: aspartoacylase [Vibrio]MDA0146535.1 aspartoacylase [Vibrio sp. RW]NAZ97192.1 aspartoacylase [Vibrio toranzoniae]